MMLHFPADTRWKTVAYRASTSHILLSFHARAVWCQPGHLDSELRRLSRHAPVVSPTYLLTYLYCLIYLHTYSLYGKACLLLTYFTAGRGSLVNSGEMSYSEQHRSPTDGALAHRCTASAPVRGGAFVTGPTWVGPRSMSFCDLRWCCFVLLCGSFGF